MSNLLAKLKLSPSKGGVSLSTRALSSTFSKRTTLNPIRSLKTVPQPEKVTNYPQERIGRIQHPYLRSRPKRVEPVGNRFFLTPVESQAIDARIKDFPKLQIVDPQSEVLTTDLKNLRGEVIGTIELDSKVFKVPVRKDIIHRSCKRYLASRRQGTHSQKSKSEVSGGGKKPRPQKGSGQARQGSIRAPHYRGGGAAFPVKPRDYSFSLNRKVEILAMKMALANKHSTGSFHVVESLQVESHKTKDSKSIIDAYKDAVFVDSEEIPRNFQLSTQNFHNIQTKLQHELNPYFILKHPNVVVTKDALDKIVGRLNQSDE
eukprot:TRINITY_DN4073_c0_g2_i1.p1 TRINITY_DN4073_c0_g2~~TRINITY_DN4073_c0_g2_i1.p1  ORF type:complete len:325 (+),score=102.82 TRINITY_DN4073_c0_g2_i1:25-975(+)